VRELQRTLDAAGVQLTTEVDENTEGPGSFTLLDPDGNPILVDQHVWSRTVRRQCGRTARSRPSSVSTYASKFSRPRSVSDSVVRGFAPSNSLRTST
jgi:hypothetical protein